jgi:hypothetical protein
LVGSPNHPDALAQVAKTLRESGFQNGMTATEAFDRPKSLYSAMFTDFSTRFPVKTYRP